MKMLDDILSLIGRIDETYQPNKDIEYKEHRKAPDVNFNEKQADRLENLKTLYHSIDTYYNNNKTNDVFGKIKDFMNRILGVPILLQKNKRSVINTAASKDYGNTDDEVGKDEYGHIKKNEMLEKVNAILRRNYQNDLLGTVFEAIFLNHSSSSYKPDIVCDGIELKTTGKGSGTITLLSVGYQNADGELKNDKLAMELSNFFQTKGMDGNKHLVARTGKKTIFDTKDIDIEDNSTKQIGVLIDNNNLHEFGTVWMKTSIDDEGKYLICQLLYKDSKKQIKEFITEIKVNLDNGGNSIKNRIFEKLTNTVHARGFIGTEKHKDGNTYKYAQFTEYETMELNKDIDLQDLIRNEVILPVFGITVKSTGFDENIDKNLKNLKEEAEFAFDDDEYEDAYDDYDKKDDKQKPIEWDNGDDKNRFNFGYNTDTAQSVVKINKNFSSEFETGDVIVSVRNCQIKLNMKNLSKVFTITTRERQGEQSLFQ